LSRLHKGRLRWCRNIVWKSVLLLCYLLLYWRISLYARLKVCLSVSIEDLTVISLFHAAHYIPLTDQVLLWMRVIFRFLLLYMMRCIILAFSLAKKFLIRTSCHIWQSRIDSVSTTSPKNITLSLVVSLLLYKDRFISTIIFEQGMLLLKIDRSSFNIPMCIRTYLMRDLFEIPLRCLLNLFHLRIGIHSSLIEFIPSHFLIRGGIVTNICHSDDLWWLKLMHHLCRCTSDILIWQIICSFEIEIVCRLYNLSINSASLT
jgi:hypothetical protein